MPPALRQGHGEETYPTRDARAACRIAGRGGAGERAQSAARTRDYVVRFTAPEFTTLCPITGQPDFAHFVIDYCPAKAIVESKSLKLFLASFRNHAAFHEDCTLTIGKRVAAAIKPKFLRIAGFWYPRGGIPIDVFWQTGKLPQASGCPIRASRPIAGAARAGSRTAPCSDGRSRHGR